MQHHHALAVRLRRRQTRLEFVSETLPGVATFVILRHGIGYDNVDVPACTKHGIVFANEATASSEGTVPAQEQERTRARAGDEGNGSCQCQAHEEQNQNAGTDGEPQQEQERNVSEAPTEAGPPIEAGPPEESGGSESGGHGNP